MNPYPGWLTLREIDERRVASKGVAFRHFKMLESVLVETRDYRVLHHEQDRETIEHLRSTQRIYGNSINVVLLSPQLGARLLSVSP